MSFIEVETFGSGSSCGLSEFGLLFRSERLSLPGGSNSLTSKGQSSCMLVHASIEKKTYDKKF